MQNPEQVMSACATRPLGELEKTIARGKQRLMEMGLALGAVRDLRLYRREYRSFDEYCRAKWGCSRQRIYRLIRAAHAGKGHRPVTSKQKTQAN